MNKQKIKKQISLIFAEGLVMRTKIQRLIRLAVVLPLLVSMGVTHAAQQDDPPENEKNSPTIYWNTSEEPVLPSAKVTLDAVARFEQSDTGQVISYTVDENDEECKIDANALRVVNMQGSSKWCTVIALAEENDEYGAAEAALSIHFKKIEQTIEVAEELDRVSVNQDFTVGAEASSDLPVTVSASGACQQISASTIRATAVGVCKLTFTQEGNIDYFAADVNVDVIVQAGQTINITQAPPTGGQYQATVDTAATSTSGLPVVISASGCEIENANENGVAENEASIKLTAIGKCTVTYNQPGGEVNGQWFSAAPSLTRVVTVARWSQTIEITKEPPQTKKAGTVVEVEARAIPLPEPGEGERPVDITVASNSDCTIQAKGGDWAEVLLAEEGSTCTIYFNQEGDNKYGPAPQVARTVVLSLVTDGRDIDNHWKARKLFTTAENQPIMAPPMVARDPNVKAQWPNVMVIFGTGKYHEKADVSDKSLQSIYGIHDRGEYNKAKRSNLAKRVFTEHNVTLANGEGTQLNRKVDGDKVNWKDQYGWYIDLASDLNGNGSIDAAEMLGERSVFRPFLANRLFVFNTVQPVIASCEGATKGWTMLIDWTSGLAPDFPVYDANMDGIFSDSGPNSDQGFIGYFNETAASELGRGGDSIYDTSGDEARRRQVTFGIGESGVRLGWEEKQPFGVLKRN